MANSIHETQIHLSIGAFFSISTQHRFMLFTPNKTIKKTQIHTYVNHNLMPANNPNQVNEHQEKKGYFNLNHISLHFLPFPIWCCFFSIDPHRRDDSDIEDDFLVSFLLFCGDCQTTKPREGDACCPIN